MEDLILHALKYTTSGNWIIANGDLERARVNFDDFCKYLDNDDRVCEYEIINGGINILFWLDYCENLEKEED